MRTRVGNPYRGASLRAPLVSGAAALASVIAAVAAAPDAGAAITRHQAVADAHVTAASRNANYGRARALVVDGAPVTRSYIRFDVRGTSGGVKRVTLELTVLKGTGPGLSLRRARSNSWTERAIRFRNAPGMTGPSASSGLIRRGRLTIDVTRLVAGNGPVTLVLSTRGRAAVSLASREAGAAARPVLVVTTNGAPSCTGVTLTTNEDAPGSAAPACTDPDGDPLTYSVSSQGSKGTATAAGGGLTYTPNANANGSDSVSYQASDGSASSAPANVAVTIRPVNDAPVCQARSLAIAEDASGLVDPACTDVDGDALTYLIASQGTKGTATINEASRLRYVANANANGSDSFSYSARDSENAVSEPAAVSVTIAPVNDKPVAVLDAKSVEEDGSLTFPAVSLALNDAPGPANEADQALLVTAVGQTPTTHGTVSLTQGEVTYTPAAGFHGSATFTYTVCDNGTPVECDTGTVSVSVGPVNDPPTCEARSLGTSEDTPGSVAPLCTDPEGGALTYEIVTQATKGTASVVSGELRYEPTLNANGDDTFTYRARDASGAPSAPATVSVAIAAVNDAPACLARTLVTDEEQPGAVAPSCTDVEGHPFTYAIVAQGAIGTASVESGELRYEPDANANGDDSFTYRAVETVGGTASAPATVSVTIRAINDVPEAVPLSVTTTEGTPKTVTLDAVDAEGEALTFRIETLPANGTLYEGTSTAGTLIDEVPHVVTGNKVTYAPSAGFAGADSFEFTANDGVDTSLPETISIAVRAVNSAPVCTSGSFSVEEDGDLLDTVCSDEDGDDLSFASTGPSHGTLELFDDGDFSYVPDANYNGSDEFTVTATDPDGASSAEATITLTVTPVNDAPECDDVELDTNQDAAGETAPFCFDLENDALTYEVVAQPTKGTASVTPAGQLRYVPDPGATGSDSFTYRASDGVLASAPASVAVQIATANTAPACSNVSLTTPEDDNGIVAPNCTDPEGDPLTYQVVSQGSKGTASVEAGEFVYAPNADQNGADSFTYRASDGDLASATASVSVTISPVNDPPVANLDEFPTVLDGASVDIDVRRNDLDGPPDESSQSLTVTGVSDPATGAAAVVSGRVRYTPEEGALGDVFTYTVCDNGTPSACATGTISAMVVFGTFATVETTPVAHTGDAADDPAIWVHPTDPSLSTVIGTDKLGGIVVYDLAGAQIQTLETTRRMNNVDLRDGFALPGQPAPVTLVVASDRTGGSWRFNVYRVDVATRGLVAVRSIPLPFEPYGVCLYESATSGKLYVFANEEDSAVGRMEQWELAPDASAPGGVRATQVRQWNVGSEAEGCVADDELGHLYVAEEDVGIWKYGAEPDAGTTRTAVDSVDHVAGHLRKDVEGLAIVYGSSGTGYLLASSQGNSSYAVYRREGANAWLRNVRLDRNLDVDPIVDGVTDTDGIDVTAANLGPAFPNGLFVVQDGTNTDPAATQNFKLAPLDAILGGLSPPF